MPVRYRSPRPLPRAPDRAPVQVFRRRLRPTAIRAASACAMSQPWLLTLACLAWRDPIGSHGGMRTTLTIACAMAVFPVGAQAQDNPCRAIKDDGKRLKCYDRLDRSSSSARETPRPGRPGGDTAWIVTDEKSPLDDSPLVSAALASSDDRAHLLMRCKDRKTEVAVSMTGFIKCDADVRVIYRIDQEQAVETPWRSHPSCYLALAATPIPFIRELRDGPTPVAAPKGRPK